MSTGGKLGRSLAGKSEQAGNQRGGAADLLADLRGLRLFQRRQAGRAEQVGVSQHGGERVVDLVGGSAHQLAERGQLLRLNELFLQILEVVERTAGPLEKPRQLVSEQALPPENHDAHHHHGQKTHGNAEGLDRRRKRRVQFAVQGGPEEAEQSEHAQASDPDAEQRPRRLGVGQIQAEGEQGSHRHPGYGNGERDVVDAAAVVKLVADGPVGDIGTGGIECAGAEQLSVKLPPAAVSGVGEDGKRRPGARVFRSDTRS